MSKKILKKVMHLDLKSFIIKSFETLHPGQEFDYNWHIDLIFEYLKAVEVKQIKRLVINIPPRSLKSFCVSVAWPAWILGNHPHKKIIVVSYSQALSNKLSGDCKAIVESDWFKQYFPKFKIKYGQNIKQKFATTQHGFRFATSTGSTLLGEGADIIIVDDPQTPLQVLSETERTRCIRWFEQTLSTRLNNKNNGSIVIVMQRLHVEDLTGFINKKNVYKNLILPAVAREKTTVKFNDFAYVREQGELLNVKRDMSKEELIKEIGDYTFESQYQQNPQPMEDGVIKSKWLSFYGGKKNFEQIYQSWDCAIKIGEKNDFSVCTTWGVLDNNYYLINVFKGKLEYPYLKDKIHEMYKKFKPSCVLIEDKASGQQLIQELQKSEVVVIKINPKYNKTTRLILVSPLFESGKIHFSKSITQDFIDELLSFPHASHDDQVDSLTQFLFWITSSKKDMDFVMRRV